ncbi:MAG: 2-amino-4-hydroxy-6-hydroxymethyldihydropteridine diphosphokinase [Campylobacterota bacterium]|nr:2-amino-4-hydroxy-6-hydroxymethyldihydropteridine diphosphokinase [Campylobacterota bacterium]
MKKIISTNLILYFNNYFPYENSFDSKKKNIVTIGIGGNIGDVKQLFKKLFLMLKSDSRFTLMKTSPLLENPPFGYIEQNNFINAIIVLKTNLSAQQSLKAFQRYENRFKRVRSFKDAPRTLDIDIIFFNDDKIDTKDLKVPHCGYKNRDSVQIPLKFI